MSAEKRLGWDPHKLYDVSPEEKRLIEERARNRAARKAEFQKKVTNPYIRAGGGHIFDPAVQRFLSMRFEHWNYYKATPKTVGYGLAISLLPMVVMYNIFKWDRNRYERSYRAGEVPYADREFKMKV